MKGIAFGLCACGIVAVAIWVVGGFANRTDIDSAVPTDGSLRTPSGADRDATRVLQSETAAGSERKEMVQVSEPESPPKAAQESPKTPGLVVPVPGNLRGAFSLFRDLARHEGTQIPKDLELTAELWERIRRRMRRYQEEIEEIDKERMPIIDQVAEQKRSRGEIETHVRPVAAASKQEMAQFNKAVRAARNPNRADQTVVRGGRGDQMWFVRVDKDDDFRLTAVHDRIHSCRRQAVGDLLVAVGPYLRNRGR